MAQAPIVEYGVRNALAAHRLALHRSRFRSSFRDWEGNETHFPREIAEHALAHVIGDKAEQAYRRSDALTRRRKLMDAWARHCESGAGENVVAFKGPAVDFRRDLTRGWSGTLGADRDQAADLTVCRA
jgi:hypothetical protein